MSLNKSTIFDKRQNIQIAIDGPGGSGKSTIAKKLSQQLGFTYIDTGAMYRAIALYCINNNISSEDKQAVIESLHNIDISIHYIKETQQVFLNNENVSDKIRTLAVGQITSVISAYEPVRAKLLNIQRNMASLHNVVMDGRDIGTVILPTADLKIFLTASVETRAKRRQLELAEKGETPSLDHVINQIKERDHRDYTRDIAPLIQATDAVLIDTTDMTIDETVKKILILVEKLFVEKL